MIKLQILNQHVIAYRRNLLEDAIWRQKRLNALGSNNGCDELIEFRAERYHCEITNNWELSA